jgi:hypothetical protein
MLQEVCLGAASVLQGVGEQGEASRVERPLGQSPLVVGIFRQPPHRAVSPSEPGGIGPMHLPGRKLGLAEAIDRRAERRSRWQCLPECEIVRCWRSWPV